MAALLVLCLIPQLGDDSFAARQAAHASIASLLPAGLDLIEEAAADNPELEIRRRCQRLVREYDRRLFSAIKYPWIDSLPSAFLDRSGVLVDYLSRARLTAPWGNWINDFPDYRLATELLIWDMRCADVSRADLLALIEEMRANDRKQIAAEKARRLVPIPTPPVPITR